MHKNVTVCATVVLFVVLLVVCSCAGPETNRSTAGASAASSTEQVLAPPPATQQEECVKDCQLRNQMRAVSAGQIETDCRRECSAEKIPLKADPQ